jgi:hypothetical protein
LKQRKLNPPAVAGGEGSVVGLQLRVRVVLAALLAASCARRDCTGSPVCFGSHETELVASS